MSCVLTGAFNGAVAHWDPRTSQCQGLLGNRIAHKGRVHCLESDRRSGRVFSADSNGIIFGGVVKETVIIPLTSPLFGR